MFADRFGAGRLNEACGKYVSLYERRPELIPSQWKTGSDDQSAVRSSYGSDMSIDDDPTTNEDPSSGSHRRPPSTGRDQGDATQAHQQLSQPTLSSSSAFPVQRSSFPTSRESSADKGVEEPNSAPQTSTSSQTAAAARRLSVQDRIKQFENKQKESGSAAGGSGEKPSVAAVNSKPSSVLRRLSSDVSSAPAAVERAVLRRWSGVSDMSLSLDLSADSKKDIVDSPLCTSSSSTASRSVKNTPTSQSDSQAGRHGEEVVTTTKVGTGSTSSSTASWSVKNTPISQSDSQAGGHGEEVVTTTKVGAGPGLPHTASANKLEDSSFGPNKSTLGLVKNQSWSTLNKAEDTNLKAPASISSQSQFRSLAGGKSEGFGFGAQGKLKASFCADDQGGIEEQVASTTQITRPEDRAALLAFGASASGSADIRSAAEIFQPVSAGFLDQGDDAGLRDQSVSQSRLRQPQKIAVDLGRKEGESLSCQPRFKFSGQIEEAGKKDLASPEQPLGGLANKLEESGVQRMKFQKQISSSEKIKISQGRREENSFAYRNSQSAYSGKLVSSEGQDGFGSMVTEPLEQVQRARRSKGNQELNDELKMKAHELEKLFAEHKLRVPENQSSSARRSKPADMDIGRKQAVETAPSDFPQQYAAVEASDGSSNMVNLNTGSVAEMVDSLDYGDDLKQNFSELGFSDDSRGKFYEMYMQKRDERLREEWNSRRAEKEAKLKAMHDSLERNRAELKAKLSGSTDRQDSAASIRRRTERLRSFNNRSAMKREQPLDFGQSDEDDDPSEFSDRKPFGLDMSFSEAPFGNGVSRSSQGKKPLPNRVLPTPTPRTSVAPVPRSASKASTSGRRRTQAENPLAQSVPNFSDLRKENTKPSSAAKTTVRMQNRIFVRSRSANEEVPLPKEEKPKRSQSLRKSSSNPSELNNTNPLSAEGVVLTSSKFDREHVEQKESKPFLRKNNGIGPGAGAGIAKMKASMVVEAMNNEEYNVMDFEAEDLVNVENDAEEEESETLRTEEQAVEDQSESRLSQESERLMNSGSENGDSMGTFSQVAGLPTAISSTFHPLGSVQDSPGESPMSWNSRTHHPFSYSHEASDIDASAYSPMGSPASWNLHSLNQTEAEAARMRKKWGSAQKPILVANSSGNTSRKDMTKGFKRLLKFGRKSRGTDSLADWISATTSEGDDDTEDGRDVANRSSEDLRKSRMGFSQGHPSEDSFNESDFFSEQALHSSIPAPPANFRLREDHLSGSSMKAPRSFFSLSSFRSKGSDSKPR